jgi:uncharacterized membrane protein YcaP (DUF421 family)
MRAEQTGTGPTLQARRRQRHPGVTRTGAANAGQRGCMEVPHFLENLLALNTEPRDMNMLQMSVRAFVIFLAALVMLRVAHKRFFARRNALDVLLTFVLASTLARAINGSAPLVATIVMGFVLVLLHRVLSWAAARFNPVAHLVKGEPAALVINGAVQDSMLLNHSLSRQDLDEDLRINGVESAASVRKATLERNGEVSVVRNET